jgi:hypothetical protein
MGTSLAAAHHVTYAPLAALLIVLLPALAAAQEPVKSFDQLNTRLKVGDTVWVTDAQGREIKGKVQGLDAASLKLDARTPLWFAASDVRVIQERRPDSVKNGALIGLGAGGAFAIVAMLTQDFEGCTVGCVVGVLAYGGAIGAGVGALVDVMIPGKKQAVYRASGAAGATSARFSVAPVITPRTKGVVLSISF